ncbi:hypothetical protein CAPI_01235 [Corynebacterium capitovis DSM 44611]|uniref:TIGR03773 family transporter-associated surface protein n=1 Tax=Corynebacterium capitovis TaxID=131081 RepID=UPI00037972F4|nr:TIGR03773 family transporter-associated surface protein [Corynebacterium capitovis]WKD56821.1 hypothetical protein CAPI_01235 [Corynebacterium capitovis DSM 44611]
MVCTVAHPGAPRHVSVATSVLTSVLMSLWASMCLAAPAAQATATVLTEGHIDAFNVSGDGGSLTLDLKEDVTGSHVRHAPEDVELHVAPEAYTTETESVPSIGVAGYLLPQTQKAGLIWPGWDTNDVRAGGFSSVDINFESVDGPGQVYLFQAQGLGTIGPVLAGDSMQLSTGSVIRQENPSHVHANWLFTQPGQYTMRVNATASGATSNTATYTWVVGEGGSASQNVATYSNEDGGARPRAAATTTGGAASTSTGDKATAPHPQPAKAPQAAGTCSPGIVPKVKDDRSVPAEWKDPATLVFGLGDAARTQLPSAVGPIAAGEAWMIGSTQQSGVPWLGANTQHESLLQQTTGDVTWDITSFEGPGSMFVFTQGGLGQIVGEEWFRASGGKAQGSHTIPANSHVHPSWVFDKAGTYKLTVRQSATSKSGEKLSGSATLTFNVGGKGNADDGHFDFGATYDAAGSCSSAGAEGSAGGGASTEAGSATGELAETGPTVMTLPFAVLGLGVIGFGGGMIALDSRLRRLVLGGKR